MSLRTEQEAFLLDYCRLIQHATAEGWTVTAGEILRTLEQQTIYFKSGRSKTMDSMHLKKLAGDLHFFRNGVLIEEREQLKPLGTYWEGLSHQNFWGGSWRGIVEAKLARKEKPFIDSPHFERRPV